jgi:predicted RNA-binding protein with TRAM domain
MVDPLVVGGVVMTTVAAALVGYRKGKTNGIRTGKELGQRQASRAAHEDATEREPPVDIGDSVSLGVTEFKAHHTGSQVAVCKKQGFVIFVEGVPDGVDVGDVLEAEVTSFGRGRSSAEATYTGRST